MGPGMQRIEHTPQVAETKPRETVGDSTPQKEEQKDTAQVTMTTHTYEVSLATYPSRDSQFFADSPLMNDVRGSSWLPVPGADF